MEKISEMYKAYAFDRPNPPVDVECAYFVNDWLGYKTLFLAVENVFSFLFGAIFTFKAQK